MQAMEEENALEREMWLQDQEQDDLLGVVNDDASMFYADFPPLPDFPCMSSSSSSSSTPALPVKALTCSTTTSSSSSTATSSSSSAASWAVLKSDAEDNNIPAAAGPLATLSSTASTEIPPPPEHGLEDAATVGGYTDAIMGPFPYMDMLEINDFFDPALIFQDEDYPFEEFAVQDQNQTQQQHQEEHAIMEQQQAENQDQLVSNNSNNNNSAKEEEEGRRGDGEMSDVFLEWLKTNKDSVSANDLRSVKLKKATIECAAKRLGGGKEAMKQLLKLILEWVQTSHLQNKRRNNIVDKNNTNNNNDDNNTVPSSNFLTNPTSNSNPNTFGPWVSPLPPPPPPYGTDSTTIMAAPPPFPVIGYPGDPYGNNMSPYPPGVTEYNMLESAPSWPPQFTIAPHYNHSFGDNNLHRPPVTPGPAGLGGYGNQYPYQYFHGVGPRPTGDKMMRLGPSATKEARKKRMARQRKYSSHHRSLKHHGQIQNQSNDHLDPLARLGSDRNCTGGGAANPANWVYWASLPGGTASMGPMIPAEPRPGLDRTAMQTQNYHQGTRVLSTDQKRQGWKPEKNLRFLLQKVLKQSDVGSLGRIVLPKKEAETHLPELEARDGISIAMEDIGTSRVWNMRYSLRYWPNNKSRMYLLENTGDFVKANGLQEGDFIVLYSDVKCGKYMIRGVKVRQAGTKTETKKAGKTQKNQQHGNATTTAVAVANDSSSPSSLNPDQPQKKLRKEVK